METINQLLDLTGKSAIVTGGAKGIGLGISLRLAEAGASVLIADLDEQGAVDSARDLKDRGYVAQAFKVDVSNESEIRDMIQKCVEVFGALDILVNNAGIFPPSPISQMSLESFEKVLDTNLRSVFLSTKYGAEQMRIQGVGGKIINVTSIDALHPSMVGLAHYDASKHGVWGFTKNAALEYANDKIWINAIAPGGVLTPGVQAMQASSAPAEPNSSSVDDFLASIPMHRMGEPDDIGKVALFLASDMASYITGEQIVVDGGALLS